MDTQGLEPREQRVIDKLKNTNGQVLAWGTGVGKTRGSIMAANHYGNNVSVVVPAALQENYKKELNKWLPPEESSKFNVSSQQRLTRNGADGLGNPDVMVVDEAHRARNADGGLFGELEKIKTNKNIVLSASPVYNHPSDIAPLVNLAAQKKVLPENRAAFTEKYISDKPVNPGLFGRLMGIKPGSDPTLRNTDDLKSALNKYVDYIPGNQTEGFPTHTEENIRIPLARPQQDIYKAIMNQAPMWVRWKVRAGLPPNRQELQPLQAFLTGARQVANSNWDFIKNKNQFIAPKAESAVNYLRQQIKQNPRYKGVVYSNYLGSGLAPYKSYLNKYKIPYGEFSGDVNPMIRNQMVKDYNANKLKALLISSAGAEGLDLKGTRVLQILEPHFNREKEKQIIGRAIRYKSHADLPPEEQNVTVQRYLAQPKPSWVDKLLGRSSVRGTDEYISDIADRKERLNKQVMDLMTQNR
jgi:SNF2 family DNA or RNA helicase